MTQNRTILLMRHAKAREARSAEDDRSRPLDSRGRKEASSIGRQLRLCGMAPDFVLHSNALRAEETARLVLDRLQYTGRIESRPGLYLAEPDTYLSTFTELPRGIQCLLVIGHNPGISELAFVLGGKYCAMPTASLAQIDLSSSEIASVDAGTPGQLETFFTPKH